VVAPITTIPITSAIPVIRTEFKKGSVDREAAIIEADYRADKEEMRQQARRDYSMYYSDDHDECMNEDGERIDFIQMIISKR